MRCKYCKKIIIATEATRHVDHLPAIIWWSNDVIPSYCKEAPPTVGIDKDDLRYFHEPATFKDYAISLQILR